MKKIIIIFIMLLSLSFNLINGEDKVEFDSGSSGISFNDDVLSLDNFIDSTSGVRDSYAIFVNEPITISLSGNSNITSSNGIYSSSDITISGSGTLTINYSDIGINMDNDSSLTIEDDVNIILQSSDSGCSGAYFGSQIVNQAYVLDANNNMAYHYEPETSDPSSYTDFDHIDEPISLSYLNIRAKQYADLNNIDITSSLFKGDTSYTNHKGLLLNGISEDEEITYNEETKTYYVTIWNNFDDDDFAANFIEFIFNKSEWGKVIDYEVLEVKNFYKEKDINIPFVVSTDRISLSYIGAGTYSYTSNGPVDVVSNYLMFVAKSEDNSIKLKVYGLDDDYRYINVTFKEPVDDTSDDEPYKPYIIVNTGVNTYEKNN